MKERNKVREKESEQKYLEQVDCCSDHLKVIEKDTGSVG